MTSLGYYPGCSLHGTGRELDMSIKAISEVAGVELREIEDWNCCGATSAHNLSHDLAIALPYRVLALAEEQGMTDVLTPCAACFSRLKGTAVRLARSPETVAAMREAVVKSAWWTCSLKGLEGAGVGAARSTMAPFGIRPTVG